MCFFRAIFERLWDAQGKNGVILPETQPGQRLELFRENEAK